MKLKRKGKDKRFLSSNKKNRLSVGGLDLVASSEYFDAEWYLVQNPDVAAAGLDPAIHYIETGAFEGRNPGPHFNTKRYLEVHQDALGLNPLIHYLKRKTDNKARSKPIGTKRSHGKTKVVPQQSGPQDHARPREWQIIASSNYFDRKWYLANNPDVAAAGLDPIQHYLESGAEEGRDPGPHFNTRRYLEAHKDVRGMNCLLHYLKRQRKYPPISVVIPTRNRGTLLEKTIRRCTECSGGVELEFVVVDDGSEDDTTSILQRLQTEIPTLVWRTVPNGGPGSARNWGASLARHEIILFLGDDIKPLNDSFFQVHARLHGENPSDRFAVLGKVVWPNSHEMKVNFVMAHIQGRGGEQFGYADLTPYAWLDWRFFYTSNLSLKKAVISDWIKDGFNSQFTSAAYEDTEFCYRLSKEKGGFAVFYDPVSVGEHFHVYDVNSFIERQFTAGTMAKIILDRHPEIAESLCLDTLINILSSTTKTNEKFIGDYLSLVDGIKAWARLVEAKRVLGNEGWHNELLFAVFELSFYHGFLTNHIKSDSNVGAGYGYILQLFFERLKRVIDVELTADSFLLERFRLFHVKKKKDQRELRKRRTVTRRVKAALKRPRGRPPAIGKKVFAAHAA